METGTSNTSEDALNLSDLYHKYQKEIVLFARNKVDNGPPEPEDIAQQTFLKYSALDKTTKIDNPRAYLYRIAKNVISSHLRSQGVRKKYAENGVHKIIQDEGENITPESILLSKDRSRIMRQAIQGMSRRRRRIVLLKYTEGLTLDDIAKKIGVSRTTVWKEMAKAITEIDDALKKASYREGNVK
ncbi:RNA polymerase sigma factor [Paremcibacter congregatus]|uniref:RNA polymerase subunit sigma-70 n=1 Tax=Paremcibacter congregatus TaxID=2043170 RepID=A0A2G4YWX4_9PROT|nr:RNA polymerase sigma factor [Paremcibacter congregatus]PHZ86743.1 hypothetical protein CRD36_00135 [Paremcibacter congregatus]QDE26257.1 RNA polymerase sigma factor [Paremcibacter congregatus]